MEFMVQVHCHATNGLSKIDHLDHLPQFVLLLVVPESYMAATDSPWTTYGTFSGPTLPQMVPMDVTAIQAILGECHAGSQ